MGDKYGSYHTPDEGERDPSEVTSLLRQAGFTAVRSAMDITLMPALYILAKGAVLVPLCLRSR